METIPFFSKRWVRWIDYLLLGLMLLLHISSSKVVSMEVSTDFCAVIAGCFIAALITAHSSDKTENKWSVSYTISYMWITSSFCVIACLYLDTIFHQFSDGSVNWFYLFPLSLVLVNAFNVGHLFWPTLEHYN